MTVDIAIISNGNHLTTLGLKALLHEIAPSLSVGIFKTETEAYNDSSDDAVCFCFKPTSNKNDILIDEALQEDESALKKKLKSALKKLIEGKEKKTAPTGNRQLSSRETDVLRLVASGLINKEIADKLNISLQTVLTHRKHISEKLGIKTTSGFTAYAMINGLV